MNIRNVAQLKHAHFTGSGSHNTSFLISKPGAGKCVAIYGVLNNYGGTCTVKDAEDANDSSGNILLTLPQNSIVMLDAPIFATVDKGIDVDVTGVTVLYQIIEVSSQI